MRIIKKPKSTEAKLEKIVPDTSAIIHGRLTKLAEAGELDNAQIIIPEIVMGELQAQAAKGKETGFIGVEEIKKLRGPIRDGALRRKPMFIHPVFRPPVR